MKKKVRDFLSILLVFGIAAFFISCDLFIKPGKTPVSGDYTVGKLEQTAGSVTAVTITAKSGKSPGAISSIRYSGNITIPQTAGTYAVTFDVAAADGWNAASALSAGNLVVTTGGNQTPVASDYTFGRFGQTVGSVTAVTITPKSGKSPGAVSNIKYAGSTTIPQTAGTYAITFDVAAASGWNAATGLSAGNLTVYQGSGTDQTPIASDYTIGNLGQTAGSVTAVTITANSGKSPGAVSNIRYSGNITMPQTTGTYAVTFDVDAAPGWKMATGLSAGNLTVNAVGDTTKTPVSGDYTFGNLTQMTGSVTAVTITANSGKSPGAVSNIKYAGSTTIPQTTGTFAVTFDVAAATGWNAVTGLSAGNLTVTQTGGANQTPVASDFNISGTGTFTANGNPKIVSVTAKPGKTNGTVIVKYSGSVTAPFAVGTYTVTFDVAAATGWNAANGLSAGTLTINAAVPPLVQCDCIFKTHYGDEECCSGGVEAPDCTCEKNLPILVPPEDPCLHNGAEYLPGNHQALPMGEGCTCTNVPGTVSQYCDRPITNRDLMGIAEFNAVVAIINEKILEYKDDDDTYLGKLIDNIEEIRVSSEQGNSVYNSTTRVITVKASNLPDVEDSLTSALNAAVTAVLGRHLGHDTKDIIRLAMHGDKPTEV
ncbi:MAG: MBG domain-containing protein [Treponema sp.]|nr:MBG domain-containing protein [Treponema sp.]